MEPGGQLGAVGGFHGFGRDRVADAHQYTAAAQVDGAHGQQPAHAKERHRHYGHARLDGDVGSAFLEFGEVLDREPAAHVLVSDVSTETAAEAARIRSIDGTPNRSVVKRSQVCISAAERTCMETMVVHQAARNFVIEDRALCDPSPFA